MNNHWLRMSCGLLATSILAASLSAQKLKVYILAGQSNLEGHAKVTTLDYLGDDPATAPLLDEMRNSDGTFAARDDVWISFLTGSRDADGEGFGPLTTGYGARRSPTEDGGKVGPELTFGIRMGQIHDEPVLLIKTAWGGKSLHTDFRPPSAGPYEFRPDQLEQFAKQGKDTDDILAKKAAATGHYYRLMVEHVKRVLDNPGRVCPEYDPKQGYELAGFVWFQGWNDMVDRGTYPQRDQPGGYAHYTQAMAHFIRDVRRDLNAPAMPFVIGVMGVGGPVRAEERKKRAVHTNFREAMAAAADLPEFEGNVLAVPTAPYWDPTLSEIAGRLDKVRNMARMLRTKNKNHANKDGTMSAEEQKAFVAEYRAEIISAEDQATYERGASNAAYHYLGCGKTLAQIGVAFADAAIAMR